MDPGQRTEVIRCVQLAKIYPGAILAVDHMNRAVHQGEIRRRQPHRLPRTAAS
jgi:hypothetical protein